MRLDGDESGEVLSLPKDVITVGRSARTSVHLADTDVSRTHARIVFEFGTYFIEDLGSHNGTFLAGRRVSRAQIRDGDLVQFGQKVAFRFVMMDQTQERVMRRLYESSMRDPLTGADNRRALDSRLIGELAFAQRHQRPLSLILFDIDFFKNVNDVYGHPAGDEVLQFVSRTIRSQLRLEDVFARYGGEEFAVVLRDTAIAEAAVVAERIRESICRAPALAGGRTLSVTISGGCSSLSCCSAALAEKLIGMADRRLYRAKHTGRNRIVWSDA
jgi:diguanylate cyclase (GGDEF)-like protein